MTPIPPLYVTDRQHSWRQFLAGALVGIFLGLGIGQSLAQPVLITPFIIEVGQYLCKKNEGLKAIYRHMVSNVYSWHCHNEAEFNRIPVTEVPKRKDEDWR